MRDDSVTVLDPTNSDAPPGPRFRTPRLVSFVRSREPSDEAPEFGWHALYELDLETDDVTELLRLPDLLEGYDWSADGALLAYLVRSHTGSRIRPHALCLFDSQTGATSQLGLIRRPFGTGVGQREETAVTWSPNGRHILAVETSTRPSVYVFDVDGRRVIPPRDGTFGRWLGRDRILVQDDNPQSGERPGAWISISTTDGQTRPYGLPAGYRPALSPDGDMIAFDDGAREPSVYVFDIDRGTTRTLARGFAAPVWLGPNLIAATAAGPCPRTFFCVVQWVGLGRTAGIDPTTGERRRLALSTTRNMLSWHGVIDVSLPPAGS